MLKVERLMAIMLLLQARGKMTAERLAGILDVSVRTIYRDMDSLSLAHVPVSMDYGPGGGYFLPDGYHLNPASFTGEEALALALSGAVAKGTRLAGNGDGLRQALRKLEAVLPQEFRADVRSASERVLVDTPPWYRRETISTFFEPARAAVWAGKQLNLLYPRSDTPGTQWRRVEPYGLVSKAGIWYLVAYCQLRQDFRTFRMNRIKDLEVLDDSVTPRPGFNLEHYWQEGRRRFEEMTMPLALILQVSSKLLDRIDGDCEIVADERDGGAIVRVNLDSTEHAVAYALSLGGGARVLDPPDVREAIASEVLSMAALYEPGATTMTSPAGGDL